MYTINGSRYNRSGSFSYKNINYTIYYHEKTDSRIEHFHIEINSNLIMCIFFDIDKNPKSKLLEVTNNLDENTAKLISKMSKKEVQEIFKDIFLENMNYVKNNIN